MERAWRWRAEQLEARGCRPADVRGLEQYRTVPPPSSAALPRSVRTAMPRACSGSPALWLLSLWMVLLLWVYWSSLSCANGPSVPSVPSLVAYAITTERQRWGELRHTPCDGVELPAAASIGAFEGRTVPLLRTLGHREELATLANQ